MSGFILEYKLFFRIETIFSGLSKSNLKDHYGDAACLVMTAEIYEFSVSDSVCTVRHQSGRSTGRQ